MNQFSLAATAAVTVLRVLAGFIFAAHGWQKFSQFTIAGTQASFAQMGIPAAELAAPVVATLELAGGIALILGVLTRVFAALLALDMLGALFLVHAPAGLFAADGGYELVLVLAAAAIAIALFGPARLSGDYALFSRTRFKALV
ncbi:DoxX family protein [Arthrobacter sp. MPF02]|uniref:DoxX family protein n=1 Tax=Arthrobacter sp. MPF02 TaxID=3388492 RepID=UPI003984B783